jgi:hypothetical protein
VLANNLYAKRRLGLTGPGASISKLDYAPLQADDRRVGSVLHAELGQNVVHISFDGFFADRGRRSPAD